MDNIKRKVEETWPGVFKFDLRKDKEVTGRLEITICKVKDPADKHQVHSKLNGDGYPETNWIAFIDRLSEKCQTL